MAKEKRDRNTRQESQTVRVGDASTQLNGRLCAPSTNVTLENYYLNWIPF